MKIIPNLSCISIILKDKRTFLLGFRDGYYLKNNELTSEEITCAMLITSTVPALTKIPDSLLSLCYYEKTIDVKWNGSDIVVSSNVDLDKSVKKSLIDIGKGIVLSFNPDSVTINNVIIEGALGYKKGVPIHANPYRNRERIKSDEWIYGWGLAESFRPSPLLKV